jgi:hypothetical protein
MIKNLILKEVKVKELVKNSNNSSCFKVKFKKMILIKFFRFSNNFKILIWFSREEVEQAYSFSNNNNNSKIKQWVVLINCIWNSHKFHLLISKMKDILIRVILQILSLNKIIKILFRFKISLNHTYNNIN